MRRAIDTPTYRQSSKKRLKPPRKESHQIRAKSIVNPVRRVNIKDSSVEKPKPKEWSRDDPLKDSLLFEIKENSPVELIKDSSSTLLTLEYPLTTFADKSPAVIDANEARSGSTNPQVPSTIFGKGLTLECFSVNSSMSTTRIEDYIIGAQIGRGAYSVVRLAIHKPTNRQVAMKTYEKVHILDSKRKKNITREINLIKNIHHPKIIRFIDKIDTTKHLYIILEYFPGKTLRTYLRGRPGAKLDEHGTKLIFRQIVEALAYCHDRNISHRDIKLENILINDNQEIKVIDFGFSTCTPPNKKSRLFRGTPAYMAPEIVSGMEYAGNAADVWATGVLLYFLLTGAHPFKGVNDRELFRKIQSGNYLIPNYISRGAARLISEFLKLRPEERISLENVKYDSWLDSVILFIREPTSESTLVDSTLKPRQLKEDKRWLDFDWSSNIN